MPPLSSRRNEYLGSPVDRLLDRYPQADDARGYAGFNPPSRSQQPLPHQSSPQSQSYMGGQHRLPTPMPHLREGSNAYNHGDGNNRHDQQRHHSGSTSVNPYERSMRDYSRPSADATRGSTPMSQRYGLHHGLPGGSGGSLAASPTTHSTGARIRHITKDTPYAFNGGAQKVRNRGGY
jgi:hypothetical protein